ncbi:GtrA family protein [Nocardia puris]|uniref:Putative flippase GtrA n=1 Tax=Nocardia puris TaxID=208602 RepID=A0A366DJM8_9NOCA|nr:GtrA family protein [Nocardia puris]MBF6212908.1 GtrA family protein [Nocardia puris]MBF6367899.1 GtrA family protein [Nocardia puris]MBF6463248.1 GtrA family protein [Nocardia puris]RBO90155.1 putative flippase GtrA [Nocardia puris]
MLSSRRPVFARVTAVFGDEARRRELVRFAFVGAAAFTVDTVIFVALKTTVLEARPVTAKAIAVLCAITLSYLLNKQWSFRARGGRRTHHEAALFFLVSFLGIAVNTAPLWVSRYVLHLELPHVSRTTQEIADFVSAQLIGTALGMVFRFWAFVTVVFPQRRDQRAPLPSKP